MIRVLHVVTIMNRNGLENRIMDIYRNIDRNKIQFDFLTQRNIPGHFDKEIEKLGGHIYRMNTPNTLRFISYIKNLNNFFNEHKEYKIVHSHLNTISTWILFAAKKAGVPIRIAHSRTWGMEVNLKSIFKYISRIFINIPTTHKFACSKQAGEWLFGKNGIKAPNFFKVIPNSIQINKFEFDKDKRKQIRKELDLNENQIALVHVGRLVPQKNHMFIIKIFKEILKVKSDAKLFLIGEGELEEKIKKECKKMNIDHAVFFLGVKENVGDYLNAMDLFIFPSLFEGFGTVAIEAQCNGLKVLASDSIPYETKVTDIQEFMSLKKNEKEWAKQIIDMICKDEKIERKTYASKVKKAGYDIIDTYAYLENFYLESIREDI